MDAAQRQTMLHQPMTAAQIDEHVFKYHNFNMLDAEEDLYRIARAETAR